MESLEQIISWGLPKPDVCAGWALRTRRELAGIRQADLARSLRLARQRLSASENGDWSRGVDQASLARIDSYLSADGALSSLRQQLHRLRNPRSRDLLLSEHERLNVNHRVRHGLLEQRDKVLYVDTLELAMSGADLLHDQRAKRTLTAIFEELQYVSTTRNHYLIGALGIFGDAGFGQLSDLLQDKSNISPWRALEAFPFIVPDRSIAQRHLLAFLDLNGPYAADIKRHRPTIDAIYDLDLPIQSAHVLHQLAEEEGCFPEARMGALVLGSTILVNGPNFNRIRLLTRKLNEASPMLSATAAYALKHAGGGVPVRPMYRFGDIFESLLSAHIEEISVLRANRIAISLICHLTFSVHERERRVAGLALQASGLSQTVTRELFHELFIAAPVDAKGLIARNCLSHLGDPSSVGILLQSRAISDGVCRAHIAWALGRFKTPELQGNLAKWLQEENSTFALLGRWSCTQAVPWPGENGRRWRHAVWPGMTRGCQCGGGEEGSIGGAYETAVETDSLRCSRTQHYKFRRPS